MNGSISKIPAGYTVSVPALLVGTKFKVEERPWDIPLGYRFIAYDWEENTYTLEGDAKNIGWVKASESPKIYVSNKRGWEISVNKIWNDDDYSSSHAPVYVALYIGDTLSEGSVRRITGSDAVRYFFDSLDQVPDEFNLMGWITIGKKYVEDIWDYDPYKEIGSYKGPVLLLQGDSDIMVPVSSADQTARCYKKIDYKVIEGGGHGFLGESYETAIRYLKEFFQKNYHGISD